MTIKLSFKIQIDQFAFDSCFPKDNKCCYKDRHDCFGCPGRRNLDQLAGICFSEKTLKESELP